MKFRTIVFLVIATTLFLSLDSTPVHAIPIKRDDNYECSGSLDTDFDTFFNVISSLLKDDWYDVEDLDESQTEIEGSSEGLTFRCKLYEGSNGIKDEHTFEEFRAGVKACRRMLKSFKRIEQGRSKKNAGSPCKRSTNNDVVSLVVS
jgi:hypothetical protein